MDQGPTVTPRSDPADQPHKTLLLPVQYARAFAALAVFYYHISATLQSSFPEAGIGLDAVGAAGVDLFFVVSGFVIALVVGREGQFSFTRFLVLRVWRVAPLYWGVTLLLFAGASFAPGLLSERVLEPPRIIHSLLFLPYASPEGAGPTLLVGWTLNYEIAFYVLCAGMILLFRDRRLWGTVAVLCCLAALGAIADPANNYANFYTDPIILEFALGILCFHAWRRTGPMADSGVWIAMLASGLVLLLLQFDRHADEMRTLYWGVPSFMIVLGSLHAVRLESRLLRALGDASYAFYLTHVFVVIGYVRFVIPILGPYELPWWSHYGVMTLIAVAGSWALHVLVERPVNRYGSGFRSACSPGAKGHHMQADPAEEGLASAPSTSAHG